VTLRYLRGLLIITLLVGAACAGPPIPYEPDVVDVVLPSPADQVRATVIRVLTDDGYEVKQEHDQNLTTGYREEIRSPWDGLLHWRFGTSRSFVHALVTPVGEDTTRLRLHVFYEGKDGLFTRWEESPTALPQSADHQLRRIKNALHILGPYPASFSPLSASGPRSNPKRSAMR
jgi:hypothetical protein